MAQLLLLVPGADTGSTGARLLLGSTAMPAEQGRMVVVGVMADSTTPHSMAAGQQVVLAVVAPPTARCLLPQLLGGGQVREGVCERECVCLHVCVKERVCDNVCVRE